MKTPFKTAILAILTLITGANIASSAPSLSPTVTSPTATSLTAASANLGGNVTNDGGAMIIERGVVFSVTTTNADPLINGAGVTKLTTTGTTGVFSTAVTGLAEGISYSYKAYAINSQGTSYTSAAMFATLSTNANLSNLTASSGTLSPAFDSSTFAYTTFAYSTSATTSITVTPTCSQANATIEARFNGGTYTAVTGGSPSSALTLNIGVNTVDVRVTAQDKITKKTYTVSVTIAAVLEVKPGQAATLNAPALGSSSLNYQWVKDGVDLQGQTNSSISLGAVQFWHTGDYSVRITDIEGKVNISPIAAISVSGSPYGAWRGLVGYYPLDGNTRDESLMANHLTQRSATLVEDRKGRVRRAWRFDGLRSSMFSSADVPLGQAGISIALWMRIEPRDGLPGTPAVLSLIPPEDANRALRLALRPEERLSSVALQNDLASAGTPTLDSLPIYRWFHLAVTSSGTTGSTKFYINGESYFKDSEGLPQPISREEVAGSLLGLASRLCIGANSLSGDISLAPEQGIWAGFKGSLDELCIFNRVLSDRDVVSLYAEQNDEFSTQPSSAVILPGSAHVISLSAPNLGQMCLKLTGAMDNAWRKDGLALPENDPAGVGILMDQIAFSGFKPWHGGVYQWGSLSADNPSSYSRASLKAELLPAGGPAAWKPEQLLLWLPFSGTIRDLSPGARLMSIQGLPQVSGPDGMPKGVARFETSTRVRLEQTLPDREELTLSLLFKPDDVQQESCLFFDGSDSSASEYSLSFGDGRLNLRSKAGLSWTSPQILQPGKWHHLLWSMSKAQSKVFLDGVLISTLIRPGGNVGSRQLVSIGYRAKSGGSAFFVGEMSALRLFGYAVGDDVAQQIYRADAPPTLAVGSAEVISNKSVQVTAGQEFGAGMSLKERGFLYCDITKMPVFGGAGVIKVVAAKTGEFTAVMPGLKVGADYWWCAYALYSHGVEHSHKVKLSFFPLGSDSDNGYVTPFADGTRSESYYYYDSVTIEAGKPGTLYAFAPEGYSQIGYQWKFKGLPIPGATSSRLNYPRVSRAQEGWFTCVFTLFSPGSGGKQIESDDITVWVETPPVILYQSTSTIVMTGREVNLWVWADGRDLAYQWRKNGVPISDGYARDLSLTAAPDVVGVYDVVVSNGQGSVVSAPIRLQIVNLDVPQGSAPEIVVQPESMEFARGESVSLSVQVNGTGLVYQWRRNGVNLTAAGKTLLLRAASEAQEGVYDVIVRNSFGSVISSPASLTLSRPFRITAQPSGVAPAIGDATAFEVGVEGADNPVYQWFKDGKVLQGETSARLELQLSNESHNGWYHVVISSAGQQIKSSPARLVCNAGGVLVYRINSTGKLSRGAAISSLTQQGWLVVDRAGSGGAMIRLGKSGGVETFGVLLGPTIRMNVDGSITLGQALLNQLYGDGSPGSSFIWLTGSSSLVNLQSGEKLLLPKTLSGSQGAIWQDQTTYDTRLDNYKIAAVLDEEETIEARAAADTVDAVIARLRANLFLRGAVER